MPDTLLTPALLRLSVDWAAALPRLEALGPVRVVTANAVMVHEKVGTFGNVSAMGPAMIVLNRDVDLRVFPGHWQQTVYDAAAGAIRVHDGQGRPVHAIHRTGATDAAAWDAFIADHRAAAQEPLAEVGEPETAAVSSAADDAAIDVPALRAAWAAMTDVHEFHDMLKRFGAGRLQAMRLAGTDFARPVPVDALPGLLDAVRAGGLEIMIFVGNGGCIQIHTGTLTNVQAADGALAIDDPGFRLACDTAGLATAWVVYKPTDKGGITTVELYDSRGGNCAILCGQRDEDKPERADWRALAQSLPSLAAAAA